MNADECLNVLYIGTVCLRVYIFIWHTCSDFGVGGWYSHEICLEVKVTWVMVQYHLVQGQQRTQDVKAKI